jgi:hypothetical protein
MAEADPFASVDNTYSIVVAGNMNPTIHHPAWYKFIKALSDEEFASTGAGGGVPEPFVKPGEPESPITPGVIVCTPAFSQFTAGRIRVVCVEQTWTIATPDLKLWDRIRDIAVAVFEALGHTPVAAYGLNFAFHRKTKVVDVADRLAKIFDSTALALPKNMAGSRSAKLGYSLSQTGRSLNLSIEPSVRSPDAIFVAINAHHPIVLKDAGFHQFDLGPLLRDSCKSDMVVAQDLLAHITRNFEGYGA